MSPPLDEKTQSRLVAILAADGVGYSRLMSVDESAIVEALHAARQHFIEQTAKYGGRD